MNGYDYKNLRKLVPENQVDPVLNISKQKKRKRVKDSPKVNLGGVSKHFDGRDFVGDDVGFNIGKVVQQDQVADLTKQVAHTKKEKEKKSKENRRIWLIKLTLLTLLNKSMLTMLVKRNQIWVLSIVEVMNDEKMTSFQILLLQLKTSKLVAKVF